MIAKMVAKAMCFAPVFNKKTKMKITKKNKKKIQNKIKENNNEKLKIEQMYYVI